VDAIVIRKAKPKGFNRLAMGVHNCKEMALFQIQPFNLKTLSLRPRNCGALIDLNLEAAGTDFPRRRYDLPPKRIRGS
jgi:hypothetical protein